MQKWPRALPHNQLSLVWPRSASLPLDNISLMTSTLSRWVMIAVLSLGTA